MFERRLYYYIDWAMVIAVLALAAVGVAMIASASGAAAGGSTRLVTTQVWAIGLGLVAMALCLFIDYRNLAEWAPIIYGGVIVLLVAVFIVGVDRGGARRWIPLGLVNLQPSEFAKLAVALMLAKLFSESTRREPSWGELGVAALVTAIPMLLIARQPDLGTAVTLLVVLAMVAFLGGIRLKFIGVAVAVAIVAAPLVWRFALHDYQKGRIVTFLDPERDPRGAGYQQLQARITVGSGGLVGKGYTKGTQGQLRFLPVASTDFIFSALAEEMGLLGVLATLSVYLFVILRSLQAARLAKDRLGTYLVAGVLASFTFQVIYNVAMSAGMAPVKGLTLPLMSYGGSAVIATLAGFGLILNVRMRRFTN